MIKALRFLPILKKGNSAAKNNLSLPQRRGFTPKEMVVSGFTLIELLMVSSIMAIAMVAIYSCFIAGMKVWQRCRDLNQAEFKIILGSERISAQIRQAVNFPSLGFIGRQQEFSFPALDNSQIIRVSFIFDSAEKKLKHRQERYGDIIKGKGSEVRQFMERMDKMTFAYYYFDTLKQQYLWKEEWKQSDGIPLAVRITFEVEGRSKSETVFIPIA